MSLLARRDSGAYGFSPISRSSSVVSRESDFGFPDEDEEDAGTGDEFANESFGFEDGGESFGFESPSPAVSRSPSKTSKYSDSGVDTLKTIPEDPDSPISRPVSSVLLGFESSPEAGGGASDDWLIRSKQAAAERAEASRRKRLESQARRVDRASQREPVKGAMPDGSRHMTADNHIELSAASRAAILQKEARIKEEDEEHKGPRVARRGIQPVIGSPDAGSTSPNVVLRANKKEGRQARERKVQTIVDFSLLQTTMTGLRAGGTTKNEGTQESGEKKSPFAFRRSQSHYHSATKRVKPPQTSHEEPASRLTSPKISIPPPPMNGSDNDKSQASTPTKPLTWRQRQELKRKEEAAAKAKEEEEKANNDNQGPAETTATTVPIVEEKKVVQPAKPFKVKTKDSPATAAPSSSTGDEYEDLDPKALEAAKWTNDQIAKLIDQIKHHGTQADDGQYVILFEVLFEETANIFDALSGICKTAKKYKVVDYDAEQLWQGKNDKTEIRLLKDSFEGITVQKRRKFAPSTTPKTKGFGTVIEANAKCHVCSKTVYQNERIVASDKPFHKTCFRCFSCNKILSQNDYYVSQDFNFRCGAHHREYEMAQM